MARIIREQELQKITGLSRSTLWRLEKAGNFPKRLKLGGYSIGWRETDVTAWIDNLCPIVAARTSNRKSAGGNHE
ncbi:MAG: hypothetical protein COT73_09675 [Bdellovibrio sp. CG10_big_fil_rev_8_21_14_0_10_47_8]|nr:MAG: hypothetical protein COT73_09675 [Bdellovibrio sp. CG10_big_fil_rev_8_21_14_0_10_47_8]